MKTVSNLVEASAIARSGGIAVLKQIKQSMLSETVLSGDLGPLFTPLFGPPHIVPAPVTDLVSKEDSQRTTNWHIDQSFVDKPPEWSALYCVDPGHIEVPTVFCDSHRLFLSLSNGYREMLRGLDATHYASYPSMGVNEAVTSATHPVVVDVETDQDGGPALFIAPATVNSFVGWESWESHPILEYLFGMMNWPEFTEVHHWAAGDLLIWPSRRYPHRVLPARSTDSRRHLQRAMGHWRFS